MEERAVRRAGGRAVSGGVAGQVRSSIGTEETDGAGD